MAITEAVKKLLTKHAEDVLNSNKPLNSNGIGTGAMISGFVGKVTGYEWGEVVGARTVVRNNQQILVIDGKPTVIAEKNKPSLAFYMVFDNGAKRVTTTLLEQNTKSTISLSDGEERKFTSFVGTDYKALIGKVLRCDTAVRDTDSAPIQRLTGETTGTAEAPVGVMSPQSPMLFKFTVIADEALATEGAEG